MELAIKLCTLTLLMLLISGNATAVLIAEQVEDVKRSEFPDGFLFGVSTSSYQIEGGFLEDGKELSDWDVFVHSKGNVKDGDTGDIAADHYHRYLEDIDIIHSLGVDAYRFSISWARILPRGRFGGVNPAGVSFYNKIIDNLLLRGIRPFVTINHVDIPQELQDRYGGWLSHLIQDDFAHFAKTCFKSFGDRVKYWITINEPNLVSLLAFERGEFPPSRCSATIGNCSAGNSDIEPLISMQNKLLAHAKAAKLYRHQFQHKQGGIIGIIASAQMYEPLTDNENDMEAANRALAFSVGWTFDPLVYGDYPPEMRRYLGNVLPTFTFKERRMIKDSIDFIGINHYTTLYAKDCIHSTCACNGTSCNSGAGRAITGFSTTTAERDGVLIGKPTGMGQLYVVPRGMEEIVEYVKKRYHNMPMFITENGYSPPEGSATLEDFDRMEFHKAYLTSLAKAIREGADVRGYFIWTLMDDFEWVDGYDLKFGLYAVDRVTLNRIPRLSAKWYRDFLRDISVIKLNDPSASFLRVGQESW